MKATKQAILFLTHVINDEVEKRFLKLLYEELKNHDVFFACESGAGVALPSYEGARTFVFSLDDLMALGYNALGCQVMHNVNYALLLFLKRNPLYDCVWLVEYDVVFTGNWNTFFSYFSQNDAGLISSHIERLSPSNQLWPWWHKVDWAGLDVSQTTWVKSFNPIFRLSAQASASLDRFLRCGVQGHYECTMATALYREGFRLLDYGGTGEFSEREHPNHFCIDGYGVNNGTMRWRPVFLQSEIDALGTPAKLFHPVKFI